MLWAFPPHANLSLFSENLNWSASHYREGVGDVALVSEGWKCRGDDFGRSVVFSGCRSKQYQY